MGLYLCLTADFIIFTFNKWLFFGDGWGLKIFIARIQRGPTHTVLSVLAGRLAIGQIGTQAKLPLGAILHLQQLLTQTLSCENEHVHIQTHENEHVHIHTRTYAQAYLREWSCPPLPHTHENEDACTHTHTA